MKRVIKSITASSDEVRYLISPTDDESWVEDILDAYGKEYGVMSFEDVVDDMTSDIRTEDIIIRILDKSSRHAEYVLSSKQNAYSKISEILSGLAIKENAEYDSATKTIHTTYGSMESNSVICAELPQDVYNGWLEQAAKMYASDIADLLKYKYTVKSASEEILGYMFNDYDDYYGDSLNKLSPRPEELF